MLVTIDAAIIPLGVIGYFGISMIINEQIRSSVLLPWFLFYALLCVWSFLYSYLVIARANRDAVMDLVNSERKWANDRKNGVER